MKTSDTSLSLPRLTGKMGITKSNTMKQLAISLLSRSTLLTINTLTKRVITDRCTQDWEKTSKPNSQGPMNNNYNITGTVL
jgi:hypothetical protein